MPIKVQGHAELEIEKPKGRVCVGWHCAKVKGHAE